MTANRLGFWSSVGLVGVGVAYALSLAVGFARHGLHEPITDPILAAMEVLTLLSAPAIAILMAAVHDRALPERKVYGALALAFGTLCAGTTSAVHFIELTAARQLGNSGIVWPSRTYAAELLAWDVFLGLALVFAAPVFESHGSERTLRRGLIVGGVLCLLGTIGPLVGDMQLQLVGVVGYAGVLPVVSLLLARLFRARSKQENRSGRS
ncbi:MAG TPA: hypothetical protein VGG33_13810 [Polyangia bacterium]